MVIHLSPSPLLLLKIKSKKFFIIFVVTKKATVRYSWTSLCLHYAGVSLGWITSRANTLRLVIRNGCFIYRYGMFALWKIRTSLHILQGNFEFTSCVFWDGYKQNRGWEGCHTRVGRSGTETWHYYQIKDHCSASKKSWL